MTVINSLKPIAQTIKNFGSYTFNKMGSLAGRLVTPLKAIPQGMQNSRVAAIAVFAGANIGIFSLSKKVANRVEDLPRFKKFKSEHLKNFLTDVVIVGGTTLTLNAIVSKLTQYSLSKFTLLGITTAMVALHAFAKHVNVASNKPTETTSNNGVQSEIKPAPAVLPEAQSGTNNKEDNKKD